MNQSQRERLWKVLGKKLFFPQILRRTENLLIQEFVEDSNLQQKYIFTPELIDPQSVELFREYLSFIVVLNYNRSESTILKQYWKFINEELQEPGLSGFLAEQEADVLDRLETFDMNKLTHNQEVESLRLIQNWVLYPHLACDLKRINIFVCSFLERPTK